MESEPEPQAPAAKEYKAEVSNNPALNALYGLGGIGLALGLLILAISSNAARTDYDPSGSLAWQAVGVFLSNIGGVMLMGALVAHAINWQIGRSAQRS